MCVLLRRRGGRGGAGARAVGQSGGGGGVGVLQLLQLLQVLVPEGQQLQVALLHGALLLQPRHTHTHTENRQEMGKSTFKKYELREVFFVRTCWHSHKAHSCHARKKKAQYHVATE